MSASEIVVILVIALAQKSAFQNLDCERQSSLHPYHLGRPPRQIAMLAGVDREFLKSDTAGTSRGVLSGLRVLDSMIQNNPSNLMRVIPTKGARRHRKFPGTRPLSLLRVFPLLQLKGKK